MLFSNEKKYTRLDVHFKLTLPIIKGFRGFRIFIDKTIYYQATFTYFVYCFEVKCFKYAVMEPLPSPLLLPHPQNPPTPAQAHQWRH